MTLTDLWDKRNHGAQLKADFLPFVFQFSFFHDQICAAEGLPEKYGYADCCAKAGSERHDCLISHKNATPGFIPPLQEPDAEEEDCERFQANADETIQR